MTQFSPKASIPFAELTDAPNMQSYSQGLSNSLDTMVIAKYALVADRNASNPSPTPGDMAYCADTDEFYKYSGNTLSWVGVAPRSFYKTAATSRNTTTTPTIDPDIQCTMESNSVYHYKMDLVYFQSAGTPGVRLDLVIPSGGTASFAPLGPGTGTSSFNDIVCFPANPLVADIVTTAMATGNGTATTTNGFTILISGVCVTSSGGTFGLSWAQQVSAGTNSTFQPGSSMLVTKIR